ncbi:MAG: class I SAM-dependent methyltransferase [Deltaproteobacteria bacterium]|jgi:SAM-dependent methyltransferase|nr:class I SAM-dependent methyltransferase [Deltaproteobacteria bacterium]
MNPKPEKSYRDYFIRDGIHVGDYEGMYRDCEDPWRIEELGIRLDMRAALLLLKAYPPEAGGPGGELRALDAGAGAGLFSLALFRALAEGFGRVELALNDVSPTALSKAEERFRAAGAPLPALVPYDLRLLVGHPAGGVSHGPGGAPSPPLASWPFAPGSLDLVVLAQSLWGVVLELDGVLCAFRRLLAPGGALLVSQHFPGEARQLFGREVTGPEDFSRHLRRAGFALLAELETDRASNHHWGAMWRSI